MFIPHPDKSPLFKSAMDERNKFSLLRKPRVSTWGAGFIYHFLRLSALLITKLFFHLEIRDRKFIPRRGGFLLVSNHASFLDPVILGAACPRVLNFAARDTLFRNRLFAALLRAVCAFPIKRWSADLSAVRESVRRLKAGAGLVVFPEGTRGLVNEMQNITYGFVLLSYRAGAPIVPAWISGSRKAWGKADKMIKLAKIKVIFGQPVHADSSRPYSETAQHVYKQIQQLKLKT